MQKVFPYDDVIMLLIFHPSYTISTADGNWGYIDETGNGTGAVRRVMDGVSTFATFRGPNLSTLINLNSRMET